MSNEDNRPFMAGDEMSAMRDFFDSDSDQITNF
jgi:hypothetical protein